MEEQNLKSPGGVSTGEGKFLKMKIKIKNITKEVVQEEIHRCQLCSKEFNSTKALGGHMRVHADDHNQMKTEHIRVPKTGVDCLTCSLCDKRFPSTKALSGHMRCHPDRDWRGIQPPNSSSSSSGDLSKFITGWFTTGQRGRSSLSTDEDDDVNDAYDAEDEFRIAAAELLLLAKGKATNWDSFDDESEEYSTAGETVDYNRGGEGKISCEDEEVDFRVTKIDSFEGGEDREIRVKKRQNLEMFYEGDSEKIREKKRQKTKSTTELLSVDSGEKYKCSTCYRCFSSHQALGGHRSSHNKVKVVTVNSADAAAGAAGALSDHDHDQDGSKHQCKLCSKVFTTGQALGGHQRCHYSAGPVAVQTQPNDEPKKVFLFDLNELPSDDGFGDQDLSSYNSN